MTGNRVQHVMMNAASVLAFALVVQFSACAGGSTARYYRVPAGVDSTVAQMADSLARTIFIAPQAEEKAETVKQQARQAFVESDSLWRLLESPGPVSELDSLSGLQAYNEAAEMVTRFVDLKRKQGTVQTEKRMVALLDSAIARFRKALLYNPFDLEARGWLARMYRLRADRLKREGDYRQAAETLQKLLRLDKGNHLAYASLAETWFALQEWQQAYDVFRQAERVLQETAFTNVDYVSEDGTEAAPAHIDSTILFSYVFYQGVVQAKLHHADSALSILARALSLAATRQDTLNVHSYIDWINWDDGNIAGSERRDELLALQAEGKYDEAVKGLWQLAGTLKTARARDEIEWRASVLMYQKLDKKAEGVERMHVLVKRLQQGEDGSIADSVRTRYLEDYAIMCHNLGLIYSREKKWQDAYAYFLQATQIDWPDRARSHLEIAKIVQNDPNQVIRHCNQAMAGQEALSIEEKKQMYRLLSRAYLRRGDFEKAKKARYNWLRLNQRKELKSAVD